MSAMTTITTLMQQALQEAPAVSALVDRVRVRPVPASAGTAVVIRAGRRVPRGALLNGVPTSWAALVQVECYVRGDAGDDIEAVLDAHVSAVYARLMGHSSLAGKAIEVVGVDYDWDADGQKTASATINFLVPQASQGATF